jgi:hypothetical protein
MRILFVVIIQLFVGMKLKKEYFNVETKLVAYIFTIKPQIE